MTARIVAIEGVNGAGKSTQAKLLVERLTSQGMKAVLVKYPNYESKTGKLITKYLNGNLCDLKTTSPHLPALLYATDRVAHLSELKKLIAENDYVFIDRYVYSNMVIQGGLSKPEDRQELIDFIEEIEFSVNKLPRPDQVLYLDRDPFLAKLNMEKRPDSESVVAGGGLDVHEKDDAMALASYELYQQLAEKYGWTIITCTKGGSGELRSIEEINRLLLANLK